MDSSRFSRQLEMGVLQQIIIAELPPQIEDIEVPAISQSELSISEEHHQGEPRGSAFDSIRNIGFRAGNNPFFEREPGVVQPATGANEVPEQFNDSGPEGPQPLEFI